MVGEQRQQLLELTGLVRWASKPAASTRRPNALASALVKIAYGLAAATPEEAETKGASGLRAISALGTSIRARR